MKIKINFPTDILVHPIIAETILETGALLNISQAHIDSIHGKIIADVPENQFNAMKNTLTSHGATIKVLDKPILRDEDECVDCGACISVCPVKVFSFGEDWSVNMDVKKCIQCRTCLTMCPHDALELEL